MLTMRRKADRYEAGVAYEMTKRRECRRTNRPQRRTARQFLAFTQVGCYSYKLPTILSLIKNLPAPSTTRCRIATFFAWLFQISADVLRNRINTQEIVGGVGMAVYDDIIFQIVREAEADIEERLDANILYFNSEIRMNIFSWFREIVEKIASNGRKKRLIGSCSDYARWASRGSRKVG
jgi:hypothetical protein